MGTGGPLLLVGCGKMGGALLDGWLEGGVAPADIAVIEPQEAIATGLAAKGLGVFGDAAGVEAGFEPAVVVRVLFDAMHLMGCQVVVERAVRSSVEVLVEQLAHDLALLAEDPLVRAAVAIPVDVTGRRGERRPLRPPEARCR